MTILVNVSNNSGHNLNINQKNWSFLIKKMTIPAKKSTNTRKNFHVKQKNGPFLLKKYANSGQKIDLIPYKIWNLKWKIDQLRSKNRSIKVKKSTNVRQNLDIKLKKMTISVKKKRQFLARNPLIADKILITNCKVVNCLLKYRLISAKKSTKITPNLEVKLKNWSFFVKKKDNSSPEITNNRQNLDV